MTMPAFAEPMPKRLSLRMGGIEWMLLVALSIVWGGSFFFAEVALERLPPFTIVFARVAIAAIALNLLMPILGYRMPRSFAAWQRFFAMGAINNAIPFSLIVWGQTGIASGLAAILIATTPLFAVLLAHVLTRDERLTSGRVAGIAIGFLGVVAMIGPDAIEGLGASVLAQAAVLAAAISYAFAGIYGRRFRAMPPLVTATGQVTASTILMLPLLLIVDAPGTLVWPGWTIAGALLGLGILCTAAAYLMFFRILAAAGAVNLLLVTFLIPVSALALGIVFLGERLEPAQLAGMILIGLGLAAIDGRIASSIRRRARARRGSNGDSPPA
ncbi:MAG: DMT family transporter [Dongiaceae bacterium]